ncbi:MAG: glycosyltransferase family 4 protein [Acidimicrobiales bacterium]
MADADVDLPRPGGHRGFDRLKGVAVLSRAAWRHRHELVAIHANGLAELNLTVLPAVIAGCPVVVWVHEWEVTTWSRRLAPLWHLLAPSTRFAVVSDPARRMIVEKRIGSGARVVVVPNPIDPADVRVRCRQRSGSTLRLGYIGTPARYKGFHLLPALIRATLDLSVRWEVFSGPETMMPEVFGELRSLGANLHDKVLDVREAFACCDVVVVPSLQESFGRVVAEAMANGLPVVASDLEPLRDLVGYNRAGILAPSGDIEALAAAVRRLCGDPELRTALGAEGIHRSGKFDPGPIADQFRALYGIAPVGPSRVD